ncbi:MAG: hypothetical protein KGJ30_06035 [Burkholderiales bacterium]|nr:hypothetical protein [Burkholderiales bacterium]MDE1928140.1 hypothetical protein [Burkholderiales bacterium]MDE2158461.1 hypothetical protein [Burkholderiales bacterium]
MAGEYLKYVHEFEPATTVLVSSKRKGPKGQPMQSPQVLDVDASGRAKWVQIDGAERIRRQGGRKFGDPDYVAHVLSRSG